MTREELELKDITEIKKIAADLNIKPHARAGKATIIDKIMQQPKAYIAEVTRHKAELSEEPTQFYTREQVEHAIRPFLQKPGFEAKFSDDGQTWHFRCKGAEDSGHMSVPLRVIVQKAQTVSGGARRVRVHTQDHFDTGTAQGRNAYTNTVLA